MSIMGCDICGSLDNKFWYWLLFYKPYTKLLLRSWFFIIDLGKFKKKKKGEIARIRMLTPFLSSVYSSWEVGKLQCFQWIKERFNNPNVQFCVIGDGWEECEAAQAMQWPFVKIDLGPGSCHRFPGLSLRTLGCYLSVVYGSPSDETDEE